MDNRKEMRNIPVAADVDPWQRCMELGEEADALRRAFDELKQKAGRRIAALKADLAATRADLQNRDADISDLRKKLVVQGRAAIESDRELKTALAERDAEIARLLKELDEKKRAADAPAAENDSDRKQTSDMQVPQAVIDHARNILHGVGLVRTYATSGFVPMMEKYGSTIDVLNEMRECGFPAPPPIRRKLEEIAWHATTILNMISSRTPLLLSQSTFICNELSSIEQLAGGMARQGERT